MRSHALVDLRSFACLPATCACRGAWLIVLARAVQSSQQPATIGRAKSKLPLARRDQQNQNPLSPSEQNGNPRMAAAANADFDSLIDLIVSTVATDTWAENGGGQAEITAISRWCARRCGRDAAAEVESRCIQGLAAKRGTAPPTKIAALPNQLVKASTLRLRFAAAIGTGNDSAAGGPSTI